MSEFQLSKTFVSEDDIEKAKKKRQEEWEKVRRPDQPLELPEEKYDPRTLYERLEEQKMMKQEEFDEAHKLKNQIRGLDDEEAEFLTEVNVKQEEKKRAQHAADEEVINEYRNAVFSKSAENTAGSSGSQQRTAKKATPVQSKSSQMKILAGAVKRKCSNDTEDSKAKISKTAKASTSPHIEEKNGDVVVPSDESSEKQTSGSVATVIGHLPGLGEYVNSSDESSDSASEDSDIDTDFFRKDSETCLN